MCCCVVDIAISNEVFSCFNIWKIWVSISRQVCQSSVGHNTESPPNSLTAIQHCVVVVISGENELLSPLRDSISPEPIDSMVCPSNYSSQNGWSDIWCFLAFDPSSPKSIKSGGLWEPIRCWCEELFITTMWTHFVLHRVLVDFVPMACEPIPVKSFHWFDVSWAPERYFCICSG